MFSLSFSSSIHLSEEEEGEGELSLKHHLGSTGKEGTLATHMGERGGKGAGDLPPLASKNLSPPLEPQIRNLHKISVQKRGKSRFFIF